MTSKLCIAGKNAIAVDVLRNLAPLYGRRLTVLPNRTDDGKDGWQPSLRKAASALAVSETSLDELYEDPDVCFLSLEFDRIIKPSLFASERLFNIHFSLLPDYRGCNTSIWPLLNGEARHGVTLHRIDPGVDTGDIVDQRPFEIDGLRAREVYLECLRLGTQIALDWHQRLVEDDVGATPQDLSKGREYKRSELDFGLKRLELAPDSQSLLRQYRAFWFPEYQLPTYKGREVERAYRVGARAPDADAEWEIIGFADGEVVLEFVG